MLPYLVGRKKATQREYGGKALQFVYSINEFLPSVTIILGIFFLIWTILGGGHTIDICDTQHDQHIVVYCCQKKKTYSCISLSRYNNDDDDDDSGGGICFPQMHAIYN